MEYIYLGDCITDVSLKGRMCKAVRKENGKCIRGKNGSMLVEFYTARRSVVIDRLLRKVVSAT